LVTGRAHSAAVSASATGRRTAGDERRRHGSEGLLPVRIDTDILQGIGEDLDGEVSCAAVLLEQHILVKEGNIVEFRRRNSQF
jgi:hypothetical protein